MTSSLEMNIRSLLVNCEEMASVDSKDWRLKKYIKSLDVMIEELEMEQKTEKSFNPSYNEYKTRCFALKKQTDYVAPLSITESKRLKTKQLSSGEAGENALKEIKQLKSAKYQSDIRKELLDGDDLTSTLRLRQNKPVGDDMNQASKYYGDIQEKIAEDMLSLTRSLKEQTQTANKIIKKDTALVSKSTSLSEKNMDTLNAESERLQDHSKKACKCWMWMMIVLVMVIFIFMVLFMKIMKKRKA